MITLPLGFNTDQFPWIFNMRFYNLFKWFQNWPLLYNDICIENQVLDMDHLMESDFCQSEKETSCM